MVKFLLLVLGLGLSQVLGAIVPSTSDNDLVQFLANARSFGADPDLFNYCFNIYTKELSTANGEYDLAYKACIGSADNSLEAADNATAKDRDDMFRRVDDACRYVRQCQPQECDEGVECNQTVVQELNCISSTSKQSSSTLNDVAASAALTKDQLQKNYQSIIANRDICTLQALQQFNRETGILYDDWERCLKGDFSTTTQRPTRPPTRPTTTTTEKTTTENTTDDDGDWTTIKHQET